MKSRFQGLKSTSTSPTSEPLKKEDKNSRTGKKAVAGYFSPELSRALNILRIEQDNSLQVLLGEAIDDLMRKYVKYLLGVKAGLTHEMPLFQVNQHVMISKSILEISISY